ncbi:hypothetical protein QOT17_018398 [Balamuthia mandrillaris]
MSQQQQQLKPTDEQPKQRRRSFLGRLFGKSADKEDEKERGISKEDFCRPACSMRPPDSLLLAEEPLIPADCAPPTTATTAEGKKEEEEGEEEEDLTKGPCPPVACAMRPPETFSDDLPPSPLLPAPQPPTTTTTTTTRPTPSLLARRPPRVACALRPPQPFPPTPVEVVPQDLKELEVRPACSMLPPWLRDDGGMEVAELKICDVRPACSMLPPWMQPTATIDDDLLGIEALPSEEVKKVSENSDDGEAETKAT